MASGTFFGHFIPAVFFLSFGSFYLALNFCRMRTIAKSGDTTTTFMQRFVPESNLQLMRTLSFILVLCTSVGILYEGVGSKYVNKDHDPNPRFFANAAHQTLYLLFFIPGLAGILESRGRLPGDSMRGTLVVSLAGETILWHQHALMKADPVDAHVHSLLALITLLSSVLFGVSMYRPHDVGVYVASFCGLVLQGTWLVTAAFGTLSPIEAERVGVYFVLQVLGLFFVVMMANMHLYGLGRRQVLPQEAEVTAVERLVETSRPNNNDKVTYEKVMIQDDNVSEEEVDGGDFA